jgi:hypothetical protein
MTRDIEADRKPTCGWVESMVSLSLASQVALEPEGSKPSSPCSLQTHCQNESLARVPISAVSLDPRSHRRLSHRCSPAALKGPSRPQQGSSEQEGRATLALGPLARRSVCAGLAPCRHSPVATNAQDRQSRLTSSGIRAYLIRPLSRRCGSLPHSGGKRSHDDRRSILGLGGPTSGDDNCPRGRYECRCSESGGIERSVEEIA